MEATKMTNAQRRNLTTLHIAEGPSPDFLNQLICYGPSNEGEWEDTDALFNVSVLAAAYPKVPDPPAGTKYIGTGYGQLVACNSLKKQIAVLTDGVWELT